jgi:hypothetical protein
VQCLKTVALIFVSTTDPFAPACAVLTKNPMVEKLLCKVLKKQHNLHYTLAICFGMRRIDEELMVKKILCQISKNWHNFHSTVETAAPAGAASQWP